MKWLREQEVSTCYFQEPKTERLRTAYIKACKAADMKPKTSDGEGGGAVAEHPVADDDETEEKEVMEDTWWIALPTGFLTVIEGLSYVESLVLHARCHLDGGRLQVEWTLMKLYSLITTGENVFIYHYELFQLCSYL